MSLEANKSAVTLLPSAVRSSTQTLSGRSNRTHLRGLWVLTVTANPGAQTLTLSVTGEPVGGGTGVLAGQVTGINANGTWALALGTFGTAPNSFSAVSPHFVPTQYSVQITHSGGGNWTYQLDETLIP